MSSQNDELIGGTMGLAAIGIIMLIFFYISVAITIFLAVIFTILSIIAWNNPLRISRWVYTPHGARWFVYRGLIGAFMLPFFLGFCSILFGLNIPPDWWGYVLLAGYVLGSIGIAAMFDLEPFAENHSSLPASINPPIKYIDPADYHPTPKPFEYASWDNEQEMK